MDKLTESFAKEDGSLVMVGSSATPMVIKLKMPKANDSDEVLVATPAVKEGKRVCSVCKKEFSSGKALGGHMRVHVMYHKNGDQSVNGDESLKVLITKPYYLSSVNDEGVPTCSQCGKTFPSMKSLFGHMRCHPDRVWRGIVPPPNVVLASGTGKAHVVGGGYKSSSLSCNSNVVDNGVGEGSGSGHVVDLTKYLRGWSVTDTRGRRSLRMDDSDEDDDEEFLEAVENLMILANGRSSVIEGSSNSNATSPPSIDKGKAVMQVEDNESKEVRMELGDHESDSRNSDEQLVVSYKSNKVSKKRKKIKLMNELELESGLGEFKFRCTTCNKCFSSHQALGGHRASHNKAANKLISNHDFQGENVAKEAEFASGNVISISNSSVSHVHQCKICDKVFPTGQALGGHKRCHWTGYSEAQAHVEAQAQVQAAISSQITSTGEAASTQTESGRMVFDIDLNVPAIMMEDEGGDHANANGNGYVSSSYNSC